MADNPLDQFKIKEILDVPPIGPLDFSFTNSSLYMVLCVATLALFFSAALSGRALIPGRIQSTAELLYEFVAGMVRDTAGTEGMRFFPFVFTLFCFILTANLLGMMSFLPYNFTVTSHIIVTFALASVVILVVLIYGIMRNGLGFLRLFAPKGLPVALLPIIIPIEVISFLTRPISLSVRLFANMFAGHTMLKVFAGFVVGLAGFGTANASAGGMAMAIIPLFAATAVTALEFLVAFLQAYIFAILTSIYLNDAIHPSH
ncbi:MAG: F0F1 ATP synthase subunit A [Pseudomonadota bacterium]